MSLHSELAIDVETFVRNDDLLGRTAFDVIFGLHNVPGLPLNNVIPDTARLLANVRSFSPQVRERVLARIERLTRSIGDAFEMDVQCEIERGSPPS
jgi:acetylornithine deacetylase/succinyl-diaminopimelate desuccinylase-like protein